MLWIVMPDLVPGPLDDLFVLLFLAISNTALGSLLGDLLRALIIMGAIAWVTAPDVIIGPFDDILLIILIINLIPKRNNH